MKYNITLDGVILDLLQQRFPECVFGKAKKQQRNVSIQICECERRANLFFFPSFPPSGEKTLVFYRVFSVIVKVALIWAADEQTLNLMGQELHFSDSLISFVKHALNLTHSRRLGAVQFTPLMVTSCINIGPDAYLTLSCLKCCPHLFFFFSGQSNSSNR